MKFCIAVITHISININDTYLGRGQKHHPPINEEFILIEVNV